MSGASVACGRLQRGWQTLQQQWRTTCGLWNDPVQRRFEREFWHEWECTVPSTLDAMQNLAQVMNAARQAVR